MTAWRTRPEVRVCIANGKRHSSNLYGDIRVEVETKGGKREILVKDILYVELIHSMLMSVTMMCRNRYAVKFSREKCTLQDPQGCTLEALKRARDQLFCLPITKHLSEKEKILSVLVMNSIPPNMEKPEEETNLVKTSNDIQKWHNSFGHLGINMMNSLSKLGKILEFTKSEITEVIKKCRACNMAKARALPVLTESTN